MFKWRRQKTAGNFKKEDADSTTVSIEPVLITVVVDSHEGRDVATLYIPG